MSDQYDELERAAKAVVSEVAGNWRFRPSEHGKQYGYVEWGKRD